MSLTPEQKKIRATGIGGSEIAAVLGLSPYADPFSVYARKVGEWPEEPETLPQKRGRILEEAVAQWYAEDTGAVLERCGTVRHHVSPVALATPDRLAQLDHDRRLLEIKTARLGLADQWGPSGTDEVPQHYLLQVQYTLAVIGLTRADVAVLIAGDDFRVYPVEGDVELQALLIHAAERFWRDHVEPRKPPEITGSESCRTWLANRYPRPGKELLPANPKAEALARELVRARAEAKASKERKARIENELKALIGDANGLLGDGWKIGWSPTKGRAVTDWEAVAKEAAVSPVLIEKHTERKPGRTFRPSGPLFKSTEGDDHE